jgi:hypothetical protein
MTIDNVGNVGIGTSSPNARLSVVPSGSAFESSNTMVTYFGKNTSIGGGGGSSFIRVSRLANETTTGSNAEYTDIESNSAYGSPFRYGTYGDTNIINGGAATNGVYGSINFVTSGSIRMTIAGGTSAGNVGIGTTTPTYKLEVNGNFAASTKSFKIDHPTKEGKKLIYGSLESPYHGIRLTGRNTLVGAKYKVQLPDYICKLVRSDSVNIQLTGIKCGKTLYIDDINVPENYFVVAYDKSMIEFNKTYDFFWDFTATRSDVPELITEV